VPLNWKENQVTDAHDTRGNWGRWGEDDERGALNLLSDDLVLEALKGCRTGKVYNLGVPIQRAGVPNSTEYRGTPMRLTMVNHSDEAMYEKFGADPGVGANEDLLVFASHTTTHIDSLCHVYADQSIYNGFPHDGMQAYAGAARCGIEKAGGFATRGVLVDVAGYREVASLELGHVITGEEFKATLAAQGTELRAGDAVIIRTGWLEYFFASGGGPEIDMSNEPGIGFEVAELLHEADVAVVAADNTAVEALPFDRGKFLGVHIELLVKRGIHLIEHVVTEELARERCREFLLITAPLLITGATASPVNPIAIG